VCRGNAEPERPVPPTTRARAALGLAALVLAVLTTCGRAVADVGCGAHAVACMARFSGVAVTGEVWAKIQTTCGAETESLASVSECLKGLGIAAQPVAATAEEIVAIRGPRVVHLVDGDAAHFSTCVGGATGADVVCWEGDGPRVLSWAMFTAQYSGKAIIVANQEASGPRMAEVGVCDVRGDVVGGQLTAAVPLANTGDAELQASVSYVSCTCTSPERGPFAVAPGGSRELVLQVTGGFEGEGVAYIILDTNDPLWPKRPVVIRARLPRQLRVLPAKFVVSATAREGGMAVLRVDTPAGWRLSGLATEPEGLTGELREEELTEAGGRYEVRATLGAGHRTGRFEGVVTLRTGVDEPAMLQVPTTIVVTGLLRCMPAAAFVGLCKVGQEARADVVVRRSDGAPFAIRQVAPNSPDVQIVGPTEVNGGYALQVRLTPKAAGPVEGEIRVTTDVPGEETLIIPVSGSATAGG